MLEWTLSNLIEYKMAHNALKIWGKKCIESKVKLVLRVLLNIIIPNEENHEIFKKFHYFVVFGPQ